MHWGAEAPHHIYERSVHMSRNLKTALILASVVMVFFVGVIVRHWLWQ